MKKIIVVLATVLLLQSCASLKSLPDAELDARARAVLDGPSQMEPLELTVSTDFVGERITLVQVRNVSTNASGTSSSSKAPMLPVGLYFGNGLFLEANGGLSIRLDKLAGIGPNFRGTTDFVHYEQSYKIDDNVQYSDGLIKVKNEAQLVLGKDYTVKLADKSIPVTLSPFAGFNVVTDTDGTVRLEQQLSLNLTGGIAYQKTSDGVKKSWWEGEIIPLPKSNQYTMANGVVTDSEKEISVENTGTYTRIAFLKRDKNSFRVYRTPTIILVMDESNGAQVVIHQSADGLEWKQRQMGPFDVTLDNTLDYSLKVKPSQAQ